MSIPLQSILENILSQIRQSKGNGGPGGQSGTFRDLTPEERKQRGIDPRDPNKYSIDENGNMLNTLIGWNPDRQPQGPWSGRNSSGDWNDAAAPRGGNLINNYAPGSSGRGNDAIRAANQAASGQQQSDADFLAGGDKGIGEMLAGLMASGQGPSMGDQRDQAMRAASDAAGMGRGPGRAALDAANKAVPGRDRNTSRGAALADMMGKGRIPKAKGEMTRVSPGMYRDAKGNLVRK
jgi:hypothetical protein